MSTAKRHVTKGMTWVARVIVLGVTGFLFLDWLLESLIEGLLVYDILSRLLYLGLLGIALAGFIVSWKRLWLGGTLTILISFVLGLLGLGGNYLTFTLPWLLGLTFLWDWTWHWGLPFFVAGVLFFLSWWLSGKGRSLAQRSSPTSSHNPVSKRKGETRCR